MTDSLHCVLSIEYLRVSRLKLTGMENLTHSQLFEPELRRMSEETASPKERYVKEDGFRRHAAVIATRARFGSNSTIVVEKMCLVRPVTGIWVLRVAIWPTCGSLYDTLDRVEMALNSSIVFDCSQAY